MHQIVFTRPYCKVILRQKSILNAYKNAMNYFGLKTEDLDMNPTTS